jgi:DNA replication protein DnaC
MCHSSLLAIHLFGGTAPHSSVIRPCNFCACGSHRVILNARSELPCRVTCAICEDTGWKTITIDGVSRVTRCDCWNQRQSQSLLKNARIPRRYAHCELSNFEIHGDTQLEAHRKSVRLVEQFPVVDKGLLFYGDAGVGKTHLAVALMKEAIVRKGARAVFYEVRELLKLVRDTYRDSTEVSELEVLKPVLEAELLVLDDLGAEKKSEWVDETLGLVVNTRYSERRVTVLTTNLRDLENTEPGSFAYHLGLRTRSRLKEMCEWVFIYAVDAREVPRYPTPDDIKKWEETSPASPKNRRSTSLPPKASSQAKAQLRKRESDGKADLKWPGGRAGSR